MCIVLNSFQYNQIMCIVLTSFSIQSNHVYCSYQFFNTIKSCVLFVLVFQYNQIMCIDHTSCQYNQIMCIVRTSFSIQSNHHHSYKYFSTIKSCVLFILVFQYNQIMCIIEKLVRTIHMISLYCKTSMIITHDLILLKKQ